MARPVADFEGAITQLLLPSKFSVGCSSTTVSTAGAVSVLAVTLSAAGVRRTSCVASVKTFRRSFGKHGSIPGGTSGSHGGCSPRRTSSDFRSATHITLDLATSLLRLRVKPWLRIRTTSSVLHFAGAYLSSLNSQGTRSGWCVKQSIYALTPATKRSAICFASGPYTAHSL